MIKAKHFFHNRDATHTFIILVVGILLLLAAILVVFALYWNLERYRYSPQHLANQLTHILVMSRDKTNETLIANNQQQKHSGLNISIDSHPTKNAQHLFIIKPNIIRHLLEQQGQQVNFSIPLNNQQWLNVQRQSVHYSWIALGCGLLVFILLAAIIGLCAWAIRRVAVPLDQLMQAANRFGRDIQAPPLPETGSSELQAVLRAFNQMQERIRRLLHDRTQMLAAISHDLRTPLTRLQLRAEYLQDTPHYDKALADLHEMERMIESILFFSRDYARSETKERFDINALITTLCDDLADTHQPVQFQELTQRIIFFGDLIAIKRALTNVIENAIKYGRCAKVALSVQAEQLQIKVNDEGVGIPTSEMENVFKPFYRLDKARSPVLSGAGLGLAIARDIIRAHGGDITLHNRQPHGLSVIITLPLH